jgi:predicted SAM-dependent methyltransferase
LNAFGDDSVSTIYGSNILEHFYYGLENELVDTLKEWRRVLKP